MSDRRGVDSAHCTVVVRGCGVHASMGVVQEKRGKEEGLKERIAPDENTMAALACYVSLANRI